MAAKKLDPALQAFVNASSKKSPEQAAKDAARKRDKRAAEKAAKEAADPLRKLAETDADYKVLKKFVEKKPKKAAPAPVEPKQEEPDMPLPAGVIEPELTAEQKLTREQWLHRVTREHCTDLFAKAGKTIPAKIRMSCGWPSSRAMKSKKGRVLGQCWYPEASSDGHHEIFVTPALADATEVVGVLVHELVHAVCGKEAGHGPRFKEVAHGVGLEGKMTATVPGQWLKDWTAKVVAEVGAYPHAVLDMSQQKKQSTRLLKVVCINQECDFLAEEEKPYSVRMSAKVFDAGQPCCGVCEERMEVEEK